MFKRMNRQLSSFDIYTLVSEFQELTGSYIDKIYQLNKNELLIKINNVNKKLKENIFVRNGELFCVTRKNFDTPVKPTTFAMTLRKYLSNGKIKEITQHEFDRIVKFVISKKEGDYTLVIELFSNGNIILVDENGAIITAVIIKKWAHRTIKSREKYLPPPSQLNPFKLTFDKFSILLQKSEKDLVRTLAMDANLGGLYAEEICKRAKINKNSKIEDLDEKKIETIYAVFSDFLDLFKKRVFQPLIVKENNEVIDVLPFRFELYKNENVKFKKIENFNEGVQELIQVKKTVINQKDRIIEEKIERLERQKIQQLDMIKKLRQDIEKNREKGEVIYLNYKQCEELLENIKKFLKEEDKEEKIGEIQGQSIVREFDPLSNKLIVILQDKKGNNVNINLNFRLSVTKNAEKAYNDYKRSMEKLHGAEEALKTTETKIKQSLKEKYVRKTKIAEHIEREEKRFWFEKFRWFISSDGNIVIAGKDAKNNELVVKKYLKNTDRYAHADVHGASSCVIKSKDIHDNKMLISEKTLDEACQFAASFSKAWRQFHETQAYWVLPEQVSKTPESGEYLPKGSFIIRGKRNYCRCKLEVAIGDVLIDASRKIMCGPVYAVKKRAKRYVVLEPGDMKKNDVAKILARAFKVSVSMFGSAFSLTERAAVA